ncbi:MAG: hypothetical protein HQK49_09505 [Oligoflexia bacterium]|nr:hypothetical protein [Oligoflexia bacterium]
MIKKSMRSFYYSVILLTLASLSILFAFETFAVTNNLSKLTISERANVIRRDLTVNPAILRLAATYTFTYKKPNATAPQLTRKGRVTHIELDTNGTYPQVIIYGKAQNDTTDGWDECHYTVAPEHEMGNPGGMVAAATETYNKLLKIKNNKNYDVFCQSHTLQQGDGVGPHGHFGFNVFNVQENAFVDDFEIKLKRIIFRPGTFGTLIGRE